MIVAADNLTSSNPAVAAALNSLQPQPLQDLARRCEDAGAALLDLNPGYLSPRHEDRMTFMVDAVQSVTGLRLILDSPQPRVLARGVGGVPGSAHPQRLHPGRGQAAGNPAPGRGPSHGSGSPIAG